MGSNTIKFAYILIAIIFLFNSCETNETKTTDQGKKEKTENYFSLIPSSQSGINFSNTIQENDDFNFLSYPYIYNGGGVAIGDINNDGLDDVFLSSNQGKNHLYLNKGNFKFENISSSAGVEDPNGWTTGVSMIDINNDGWLDIYICKSGPFPNDDDRRNKLFINNKNNTFTDQAATYKLNDPGYSTQAYFFDYDKDEDLDMYLVNHRIDFKNNTKINSQIQRQISPLSSDKLYINNGNSFSDFSPNGFNKTWGLSAAIADFNGDDWLDIYVCNDFLEPDQLFINNKKGNFDNQVLSMMDHICFYSMGSDVADINNDQKMDLCVLDMIPSDHGRSKRNMKFMDVNKFNTMTQIGYHHQYMSNVLQLNRGNSTFSEIGQLSGISKTDWSWACLFADFDNDGYKDLFVTNGIRRDMTEVDFKTRVQEKHAEKGGLTLTDVLNMATSEKLNNHLFINQKNTTFKDKTLSWGLNQKSFSNGTAYSDLDNDGDLDLVVNNIDDPAFIYQNNSTHNFISLELDGGTKNKNGLGSTIELYYADEKQYHQHFLNRGFQSSVSPVLSFGIGNHGSIDSIKIIWQNGQQQIIAQPKINSKLKLDIKNAGAPTATPPIISSLQKINNNPPFQFNHQENQYNDFDKEILLPQKQSTLGPQTCVGDINNDGLEDIFISGAQGIPAQMLIQQSNSTFTNSNDGIWNNDKNYEDTGCLFIDIDNDKDLDLYVVSGGNEVPKNSPLLQDRLYINNGSGAFSKNNNNLPPISSSGFSITSGDYDNDGDYDIFVGGRVSPGEYPLAPQSYLLENKNGAFKNVTKNIAPDLEKIGIVTDAIFSDYDNDNDLDLIVVGEWFSPKVFINNNGTFEKNNLSDQLSEGWWYTIESGDFNNDNLPDYFIGNLGENNKFKVKKDKSLHLFADDFDQTGNIDIVLANESGHQLLPVRGRECSSQQMPFIAQKFPDFKSFSEADLNKIYSDEKLKSAQHLTVNDFKTTVLLNQGNGNFSKVELPIVAQYGPTLSAILMDVNKDGYTDIIGAGSIYEAEPETVRYDGSKGYILINDKNGKFITTDEYNLLLQGNIKDLKCIKMNGKNIIAGFPNSGAAQFYNIE